MESTSSPRSNTKHQNKDDGEEITQKLFTIQSSAKRDNLEQKPVETNIEEIEEIQESSNELPESIKKPREDSSEAIEKLDTARINAIDNSPVKDTSVEIIDTARLPAQAEIQKTLETPTIALKTKQRQGITRGKAILYISLLLIVLLNALNLSYAQFIGPQGWAFVIGGPGNTGNDNPLAIIKKELNHDLTPGATAQATHRLTPQQYINLIVQNMTLDQKLGQMMIVQFVGPTYSLDISTMISQYHVGAVLLFTANNNITNKVQLKGLIKQMQSSTAIPMIVAIDQEGGTVDRLQALDGPRSSAAALGATNDPAKANPQGFRTRRISHRMDSISI